MRLVMVCRRQALPILLGLLLPCLGCASYCQGRLLDLADIAGIRLTYGVGLRGNLRATQYLQAGAGAMLPSGHGGPGGHKLGFLGRNAVIAAESSYEFGIAPFYYQRAVGDEMRGRHFFGGRSLVVARHHIEYWGKVPTSAPGPEKSSDFWTWLPAYHDFNASYDRRLWDIACSAHALVVGLEVDVSPFEVLDLLLGLIGLDPASDDPEPEPQPNPNPNATSESEIRVRGPTSDSAIRNPIRTSDSASDADVGTRSPMRIADVRIGPPMRIADRRSGACCAPLHHSGAFSCASL